MQRYDGDTAGVRNDGSSDDAMIFELAPISLWLQDLSEVKILFADWRKAGVTRLQDFLLEDPNAHERAGKRAACSRSTNER
jgi:hypothetical protein